MGRCSSSTSSKGGIALDYNVRRDHPRIFITKETLPIIIRRCHTTHRIFFDRIKAELDRRMDTSYSNLPAPWNYLISYAFMYIVGAGDKYLNKAISLLQELLKREPGKVRDWERYDGWHLRGLAIAYDWLHDALSSDLREKVLQVMDAYASKLETNSYVRRPQPFNNHYHTPVTGIFLAGLAMYWEHPNAKKHLEFALSRHLNYSIPIFRYHNGCWHEGYEYMRYPIMDMLYFMEAWKTATGTDLFQEERWFENIAYFTIHNTLPDDTWNRMCDCNRPHLWKDALEEPTFSWMAKIASEYHNPYAQWFVNHKLRNGAGMYPRNMWQAILWYDPSIPERPVELLPKTAFFPSLGLLVHRSGWNPHDLWISFKCGDHYDYHDHYDQNSFVIFKGAQLAIDSGYYDGTSHVRNYYHRTIAHNTVVIFDPNEKFHHAVESNDGGQRIVGYGPTARSLEEWLSNRERWETGDMKKLEVCKEYVYALGDATKAYSQSKLKLFQREFLIVKNKYIFVFDRVVSTKPEFKKTWLLHTVKKPEIDKWLVVVENTNPVNNVKGKLFSITAFWYNYTITLVGGSGKEFYVNGKNYPITGYIRPYNEPGAWRVEVSPRTKSNTDIFAHILYPISPPDNELPSYSWFRGPGYVVLQISNITTVFQVNTYPAQEIAYVTPKGGLNIITGLEPQTTYIVYDGISLRNIRTSDNGILTFRVLEDVPHLVYITRQSIHREQIKSKVFKLLHSLLDVHFKSTGAKKIVSEVSNLLEEWKSANSLAKLMKALELLETAYVAETAYNVLNKVSQKPNVNKAKLNQALEAYEAGYYDKALILADQALQNIKEESKGISTITIITLIIAILAMISLILKKVWKRLRGKVRFP